jgi:hypothetical protein
MLDAMSTKTGTNPDSRRPSAWRGGNLRGFALIEVGEMR